MLVDRVMEGLDVDVEPFAVCEVAVGADLEIEDLGWVTVHFVLAGEGEVAVTKGDTVKMQPYNLCLVRHRHGLHGIAGESTDTAMPIEGLAHLVGVPAGPPGFVVACGRIQANYGRAIRLFDLIDDPIVIDCSGSHDIRHLFDMIVRESRDPTDGRREMLRALMRQCLIFVLREMAASDATGLAWIEALADDRMGAVIETVIAHPEAAHSVASLSEVARMSRSAFAVRFRESFNQTPMSFVRTVRLRKCAYLLRTTKLSHSAIAQRCGFASRSHFSDTFKKEYNLSPQQFRRLELEAIIV